MTPPPPGCPSSSIELWSDAVLLDPYPTFVASADRVARFELTAEPRWKINNTLHGLETLPVHAVPAR